MNAITFPGPALRRRAASTAALTIVLALVASLLTSCGKGTTAPSATFKLTSINPAVGSSLGGDRLLLTGERLPSNAQVLVGGAAATNVTVVDINTLSVVTPAHEVGSVDVEVVVGQERSVLKGSFTYERRTVANNPPVIVSMTAQGTRAGQPARYANIGERIPLVATITDDVTAVSALTFQWTTDRGTIEGASDRVTFVAGADAGTANISLTVIERYRAPDARGLPSDVENRITSSIIVNVHSELKEIGDMAVDFLRQFSISSVAPQDVVRNFRDNCGANGTGKQDELAQVIANRRNFNIFPDWFVGEPRTTVSFNGVSPYRARRGDGWAAVNVRWRSECKVKDDSVGCSAVGQTGSTSGVDWVTSIYDTSDRRWYLCDSDYEGIGTFRFGFGALP